MADATGPITVDFELWDSTTLNTVVWDPIANTTALRQVMVVVY
jgi:hypothetical protein